MEHALSDGEDFELILAVPPDEAQRLLADQQSPMTYDADLPQEVLDEDKLIDNIPIGFDSATVVPADEVFN